jgi:uncharacterized protein (TIGR00369 family)
MAESAARKFERELLRRFHGSKTTKTFGFQMVKMQRGRVTLGMRVAPRFLQVHDQLHGGIIAALADTAAALAAYTVMPAGSRLVTLEMKINFLEGVERGEVQARGRVLRAGRSTIVSECDVRDGPGRLVAKALVTLAVKAGEKRNC